MKILVFFFNPFMNQVYIDSQQRNGDYTGYNEFDASDFTTAA